MAATAGISVPTTRPDRKLPEHSNELIQKFPFSRGTDNCHVRAFLHEGSTGQHFPQINRTGPNKQILTFF
jgi:hypothetical protein